jgi:ubiquinone/menaquinone biosynthesis C-methylase UbiE
MGPVVFEPYAIDIAKRLPYGPGMRVLEIAAGTGQATRHLLDRLPEDAEIIATDISLEMMTIGRRNLSDPRLEWQIADGLDLPFGPFSFDVVVCQFGVMFFHDKDRGFAEAFRVLAPGGRYLFSTWCSHEDNPWAGAIHRTMERLFLPDPILFMNRPFGYCDQEQIKDSLSQIGFVDIKIDVVGRELATESAGAFARSAIEGTPMLHAIIDRAGDVEQCVHAVAEEFRREFGDHPMLSKLNALVVTARKGTH